MKYNFDGRNWIPNREGDSKGSMKVYYWTPNGRELSNITDKVYVSEVIEKLRTLVRETSYHLARLEADDAPKDESFSRSASLRQQAVDSLRLFDPEAEEFIKKTYEPKTFLHS